MEYNTKNKNEILEFFKNSEKTYSPKELVKEIGISKTTIYRILDEFVNDNILTKFFNELSNSYEYQIKSEDCSKHLHMLCKRCGKLYHLKTLDTNKLSFDIDFSHSFIKGVCKSCKL